MSAASFDTTVSLEPHLTQVLKPLLSILPQELCAALATELDHPEIHYSLLSHISRWARTDDGRGVLESAQLEPSSYHIVSLLAGTRTAPSSKPPPYTHPESPEDKGRREWNDRKALAAVLNGLLSVLCAGSAAWWAASKSGWRDEWKVLLALVIAAIVGLSEIVLFIIWQSGPSMEKKMKRRNAVARRKKSDGDGELTSVPQDVSMSDDEQDADVQLRRRIVHRIEGQS